MTNSSEDTTEGFPSRERLRFEAIDFQCFQDGRCVADVELEWSDGTRYQGKAEGTDTLQGGLRAGALATLRAVEAAAQGRVNLEFVGVKAVRAFDAWVTIVAVRGRNDASSYLLLGSFADLEDPTPHSAALALLDATNRIMEKYLRGT